MPLDPKKTKNGVNLNEIDVSKLALVDKEGLIDDLGKRLKAEIKGAFTEAIKSVKPEVKSIVDDAVKSQNSSSGGSQAPPSSTKQQTTSSGGGGNSGGGGGTPPPKPPKPPKTPKQPKAPKVPKPQMNPGGGNVYSDIGKEIAENLDELTESYQTLNLKELELAQKRLSDVQESIRFSTFGKEQALLSAATADLEKELANEAKKRGTTLGKIGNFLDRENINAASIITGIFSDSPMVGLMTKAVMESIRHKRAAAQKQKSDQLKIGDIKQHLPRPDDFHQQNQQQTAPQAPQQPQTQQQAPQQPPQQATQPAQPQAQSPTPVSPQEQQPNPKGPAQVHNIGDYTDRRPPERVNDEEDDEEGKNAEMVALRLHKQSKRRARGNYQHEKYDQGYEQGKKAELEKLHAELEEAKKKAEEIKKNPPEPKSGEDIFGTPSGNAESNVRLLEHKVASIQKLLDDIEKQKADEADENKRALEYASKGERKQNNLVEMKPKAPERVQQEPIVMGKAALEHNADSETQLHPEREESGDNKIVSILSGMKTTEEKESKTLDVFSFKNKNNRINPFLELRKLSQQQLTELEKISSIMALQLEQAKLANDAAQRDTKEKGTAGGGVEGLVEGTAKKKTKEEGGIGLGTIAEVAAEGGVAAWGMSKLAKLKSFLGIGKKASKITTGIGKVAEGAEGASTGAEAVKEAGWMGKLVGKIPGASTAGKIIGKIPGASTLGKKLPIISALVADFDMLQGAYRADEIMKEAGVSKKNLTPLQKILKRPASAGINLLGSQVGSIVEMGGAIGSALGFKMPSWTNKTGRRITTAIFQAADPELSQRAEMKHDIAAGGKGFRANFNRWKYGKEYSEYLDTEVAKSVDNKTETPGKSSAPSPSPTPSPTPPTTPTSPTPAPPSTSPSPTPPTTPTSPTPAPPAPTTPTTPTSPTPAPTTPTTPTSPTPAPPTTPKPETPLPDSETSSGGHPVAAHAGMMKATTSPFSTALSSSSAAMNKGARMSPKVTGDQQKHIDELRSILKESGMNEKQINAVVGNAGKETGFSLKGENLNYGGTGNDRIRQIFGERAANKTDAELNAIKKDPQKFGEFMYGKDTKVGKGMGNTEEGDGYKFRGRGYIQLTGKNNYAAASKAIFGDDRLVKDPDLVSKSDVAAKVTAWYTKTAGTNMAKRMGIDLANGSQEDINLAYTSAIAGRKIKRGEGFLGNEVINKVDMYAQAGAGGTTPVPGPGQPGQQPTKTEVASAAPVQQPPTPPEAGKRLTQASMQNTDLVRTASAAPPPANSQNVFAPSNVSQTTNILPGVKAQNTESTYQRTMNAMYIPT